MNNTTDKNRELVDEKSTRLGWIYDNLQEALRALNYKVDLSKYDQSSHNKITINSLETANKRAQEEVYEVLKNLIEYAKNLSR